MTNKVQPIDRDDFEHEVVSSGRPVLVDFYADWCSPCKAIAPIVEELANKYEGQIDVRKVDVDENAELASQFGIRGIPTLILFKDGEPVETVVGAVTKSVLADVIDRHAMKGPTL